MKIAIIAENDVLNRCSAKGCMNAFSDRTGAFERYGEDVELVEFTSNGGNLEDTIKKLMEMGVDAVHLSTCMRAVSAEYEALAEQLAEYFDVVGYSHGSEQGRTKRAVNLKMKK